MFNIIGADGKQYGPVSVEQLRSWRTQGRINALTRIQAVGTAEWRPAREVPELASLFQTSGPAQSGTAPPVLKAPEMNERRKGMAVLSFVLGICSFVLCLSFITALPAIILGHVARNRAARSPERFGGGGFAMAGIVLGYVSILFTLVIASLVIPAASRSPGRSFARRRPVMQMPTDCQNNLRQIGLAMKVWALERNDQYPFNVSTNSGGSLELCSPGPDGFETDPVPHLRLISNELSNPAFLVCPSDSGKHPSADFSSLRPENVSYQFRTGTNINSDNPQEILAVCPVHGNVLYCDGNVRAKPKH
jgi:prepilin-type processing-associated H-X9-DG protein